TTQFLNAVIKKDMASIKKLTDFPFTIAGQMTFNTRDELDKFLSEAFTRGDQPKMTFTISSVVTAEELLKTAQGPFKDFLGKLPRGEVRAVFVSAQEGGQKRAEKAAVIVRVRGGQARVIGVGEPQGEEKPVKK